MAKVIRHQALMVFLWLFSRLVRRSLKRISFQEFHIRGKFEKNIKATFIPPIPKKARAVNIKDFRPISLVGRVYKITSKVLVNRQKTVLEKIIFRSQNAFIRGRQILDSVLVANECLHSGIRSGEPGVLYISTVCFSILINGSSSCFFNNSCGLGQWDPLSHMLFVVVMEALSIMLSAITIGDSN